MAKKQKKSKPEKSKYKLNFDLIYGKPKPKKK